MDVGSLFVKLGLDTKQFAAQLKGVESNLNSFGKSLDKAGRNMSLKVTAPITALGVGAVMTAGKFEQLQTSLEVLSGSAEDGANAFKRLQEFSAGTPFQLTELVQANNTLMGFGLNVDEAYNSLQQLGDIAAISGSNLSNVSVAFGQSAAAGRVMTQDLNQFINNGIPVYELLGEVTGKNVAELRDMASEGEITFDILQEAFAKATSQGGKFFGGMEKQSKTINGLFSTLKDNASLALGELGNAIVVSFNLEENINKLIAGIQGLTERFKNLSPEAQKFIVVGGAILAAIGPVLVFIGKMSIGVSAIMKAMRLAIPVIMRFNLAMLANPYIAAAAAITAVGVAVYALVNPMKAANAQHERAKERIEKEAEALNELGEALGSVTTKRKEDIALTMAQAKQTLVSLKEQLRMAQLAGGSYDDQTESIKAQIKALQESGDTSVEAVNRMLLLQKQLEETNTAVNPFSEDINRLNENIGTLEAQISEAELAISGMGETTVASMDAATRSIQRLFNTFERLRLQQEYGKAAQEGLNRAVEAGLLGQTNQEKVTDRLVQRNKENAEALRLYRENATKASDASAAMMVKLSELGEMAEVAIGGAMLQGMYAVTDAFNVFFTTALNNGADAFGEFTKALLQSLKQVLGQLLAAAAAAAALAAIITIATGGTGKVFDFFKGGSQSLLGGLFGGITGFKFAEGGIVSGPTLGLVGEYAGARSNPEVIAPLNKLQGMLGGIGGEVTFRIQGSELVGVLARENKRRV